MTVPPLARNLAIIAVIAALIVAVPGADDGAYLVRSLITLGITAVFTLIAVRFYRENRVEIYSLGDNRRAILYASLGGVLFCLAGSHKLLSTGGGAVLWLAVLGASIYGFVVVWRFWRAERAY